MNIRQVTKTLSLAFTRNLKMNDFGTTEHLILKKKKNTYQLERLINLQSWFESDNLWKALRTEGFVYILVPQRQRINKCCSQRKKKLKSTFKLDELSFFLLHLAAHR